MTEISKNRLLPGQARFFPFASGQYNEKPNLFPLGKDFGNGKRDSQLLQLDNQFDTYREQKLRARTRDYTKYVCELISKSDEDAKTINSFLAKVACSEHPEFFQRQPSENGWSLKCTLSDETLRFDREGIFISAETGIAEPAIEYRSGLDALACQFQEDICVIKIDNSSDQLVAAHLCFPNRWAAGHKIGKSFFEIHQPVGRFAESNPNTSNLVNALLGGKPYIRFAWGLSNDLLLDHHPDTANNFHFNGAEDSLFIRVERQVLVGLPQNNLLFFFIRTYYYDCRQVCQDAGISAGFVKTLMSINADLLKYKGLSESRSRIVEWLQSTQ
ncbi:MAG: heme-dependent oxidative N-demethylase subunit alpha family protein [Acidiferrobacterales bacterium]